MKTRTIIGMMVALMTLNGVTARENEDKPASVNANQQESIYGEWRLVGWNDGGYWFEVDANFVGHHQLSIEIPEKGYMMAYSMVNEIIVGLLTLNGNEMILDGGGCSTKVYCDREENLFFENHICEIQSYQLEGSLLRLYYTDDDYFIFTSDFDDNKYFSKAIGITWKLYGFGTLGEDVVQKAKPEKGEEWCKEEQYTILFKEDGTLKGHTFSNEFFGEYSIDGNNLVIGDLCATEIGEEYDGDKYYEALYSPLSHFFDIKNDQLLLYYNEGQNYLLFNNVTNYTTAQTDYYYGHYNSDEKIYLTLNENKVCVSIYKDNKDVSERILANVQALITMEDVDDIFDIYVISRPDFEKLASLDFWEEDVRSVILTSGYLTENNEEVYATPYLSVKLKKEEDIDLLTSYTEKYRLRIIGNSSVRPLWYTLTLTLDCEKSPLECANELYESGDFAASAPMLAGGGGYSDQTAVQNIITATTDPSSEIYDLQGRRLSTTPRKGVYIQNGKKKLVK